MLSRKMKEKVVDAIGGDCFEQTGCEIDDDDE